MSPTEGLPPVPPAEKPPVLVPPPEKPPVLPPTPEERSRPAAERKEPPVIGSLGETLKDSREISFFGRLIGKLEMGYAQWRADAHEKKSVDLKQELDRFDLKTRALDESKGGILSVAEDLKRQGMPGSESLMLKIKDLDRKKDEVLAKRDRVQSKFEARQNKVKSYTNERDTVAKELIGHYDAKLEPMEKRLESLDSQKNELDLLVAVAEIKQRARTEKLMDLENVKAQIERSSKAAGESDREIRKTVKPLEELLVTGREEMKREREKLAKQRTELDAQIVKVDEKANPYRDQREEFVRVTKKGLVQFNVKSRVKGEPPAAQEEIRPSTRAREVILEGGSGEESGREELPTGGFMAEGGRLPSERREDNRPTLQLFVEGWNVFIKDNKSLPSLDTPDFFKTVKGLSKDFKLNTDEFMKVLAHYYQVKGGSTQPHKIAFERAFTAFEKRITEISKKSK